MKKIVTKLLIITTIILTVFCVSGCSIKADTLTSLETVNVEISGNSMYPTLKNGEKVKAVKAKEIKRGDIVVIGNENNFLNGNYVDSSWVIKRVAAVEGDTVKSVDGVVYINDEVYVANTKDFPGVLKTSYEITLGRGEYFVIGDNFSVSKDSRVWETKVVPEENIAYKVV